MSGYSNNEQFTFLKKYRKKPLVSHTRSRHAERRNILKCTALGSVQQAAKMAYGTLQEFLVNL